MMIAARRVAVACIIGTALLAGCAERNPEVLLASGKDYLAKNDEKAAVIQFKNALQVKPNLAEARFLLGKTLLATGDVSGAEKELRKALELKYSEEEVIPLLGRSLVLLGQHKELVDEFSKAALTGAKGRAELQGALGTAYLNLGQRDQARAAFAAALAAQPNYAPAHLGQAQLAALSRDYANALKLLEPALASKPDYAEGWHLKGDILLARSERQPALAAYRKAVEARDEFLPAHMALVGLLIQQNEFEEASKQVAAMTHIAPKHMQTLYAKAWLAYRQKNFTAAREAIQQQLAVAPENLPGLALAGAIEFELKSYALAETHLLKVLQRMPGNPTTRQALIITYLHTGEYGKALDILKPILGGIDQNAQLLSLAGQTYALSGDHVQASQYFAKAAALDPSDKKKRAALGASLVAKGETERGMRELEQAAKDDTGIAAELVLVSTHMARREYGKALAAIASMEKKQPENPAPHQLRGTVLLTTKDKAAARRSFERAVELNPTYFPAVAQLATLDLADKNVQAARQRFDAVLAKNPQHRDALLALAGLSLRTGSSSAEVASILTKAMTAHPSDPGPRVALIGHYVNARESKKAIQTAQEAVAAMPNQPDILNAAGRAYQAGGETDQALSVYRKLASLQPKSPQPYLRMAEAHLAARDREGASTSYQRALGLQPNLLEAQRGIIVLHMQSGQVQQAIAAAQDVQKQRPKQAIGYALEGDVHTVAKNWTEAQQAYRRGLKQAPSTDLATRLHDLFITSGNSANAEQFTATWLKEHPKDDRFRMHLAQSAMSRKDYETAAQYYRKLLDRNGENPLVLNNLAFASSQLMDPKAIEYAEKAYGVAPDHPAVINTLGILLVDKGDTARGVELLKKASALDPKSPDIRFNLAKGLIKAGQKDNARKELDELAKLGEKFPRHAEVKQLRREL
jgi:cellulose synthase operon protein C